MLPSIDVSASCGRCHRVLDQHAAFEHGHVGVPRRAWCARTSCNARRAWPLRGRAACRLLEHVVVELRRAPMAVSPLPRSARTTSPCPHVAAAAGRPSPPRGHGPVRRDGGGASSVPGRCAPAASRPGAAGRVSPIRARGGAGPATRARGRLVVVDVGRGGPPRGSPPDAGPASARASAATSSAVIARFRELLELLVAGPRRRPPPARRAGRPRRRLTAPRASGAAVRLGSPGAGGEGGPAADGRRRRPRPVRSLRLRGRRPRPRPRARERRGRAPGASRRRRVAGRGSVALVFHR